MARHRIHLSALTVCIASLAYFTTLGVNYSADARSFSTGISVTDEYQWQNPSQAITRVREAGASRLLIWLKWSSVAPTSRPQDWVPADPADSHYDWRAADLWVNAAVDGGIVPLVQLYGAPDWANRCKAPNDHLVLASAPCNPRLNDMAAFFEAAARRYSGDFEGLPRVRYWQVQNEPNLFVFFNPQRGNGGKYRSPDLYRDILTTMYKTLKSVDSSNIVLAAGLAPNDPGGAVPPLYFARKLFCLDNRNRPTGSKKCRGGVPVDIFDMHPYTSGGPTHRATVKGNVQLGNLGQITSVIRAADKAGITRGKWNRTPLWVTEMSWDSRPPDPGGVPMKLLKRWTSEAIYRTWKAGASAFFWYSLRDRDKGSGDWRDSDQSGLYFRAVSIEDDRPKPIVQAYRFPFVAFADGKKGFHFWGRTPHGVKKPVVIRINTGGGWKRLRTVRAASGSGIFRGYIRARAGKRKRGLVRAEITGSASIPFSLKPVKDRPARPFG